MVVNIHLKVEVSFMFYRRPLFTNLNVLAHAVGQKPTWLDSTWQVGEELDEGRCSQGLFTEPIQWMEESHINLQGKVMFLFP